MSSTALRPRSLTTRRVMNSSSKTISGTPRLVRSLLRVFRRGFLVGARAAQDAHHRVVALVARVLVDVVVALQHRDLRGPGFRPRLRVADGELVYERIRGHARELLNEMQRRAGVGERRPAV